MSDSYASRSAATIEKIMEQNSTPWKLFVPNQKSQQLLEQSAHCIGMQATLVALGVNFETVQKVNTEWMSKNGTVPHFRTPLSYRISKRCISVSF